MIGLATVWGSHASQLEDGYSNIELFNIIIASALGGLVALRAYLDKTET